MQNIYIAIAIVILAIVAIYNWKKGQQKPLSRLTILAFAFIMGGLIFGDNQAIGYSFLGLGALFGVIDIFYQAKSK
jgi:hypothetical protein